jgi:peptidoglycan hydrolase-like protein with peptidoglycan-binding domain
MRKLAVLGAALLMAGLVAIAIGLGLEDGTTTVAGGGQTTTCTVDGDPGSTIAPAPTTSAPTTTATTTAPTTTAAPTTTIPTTSTTTTAPTTTTPAPAPPLRVGASGPAVLALEQRLSGLGYWLATPDERFDATTAHAVVAFQKLAGLTRDGVVGSRTAEALAGAVRPVARSSTGDLVEIDLTHQVLLVVEGGAVSTVLDVSTGRVPGTTPVGHFQVTREIDGYREAPLGVLYRPKYFSGGVAVHGYPSVPPVPASHGCVRTTNASMDHLWASGAMPVGTPVWVYR